MPLSVSECELLAQGFTRLAAVGATITATIGGESPVAPSLSPEDIARIAEAVAARMGTGEAVLNVLVERDQAKQEEKAAVDHANRLVADLVKWKQRAEKAEAERDDLKARVATLEGLLSLTRRP